MHVYDVGLYVSITFETNDEDAGMIILEHMSRHFAFVCRRMWSVRRGARRERPGEVAVRARGLRPVAVPRAADALRQAAAAAAVAAHRLRAGHRADVLRPARRQDAHRDAHSRHAAERRLVQLAALHARHPVSE